jgi:hypothetical protein
MKNYNTWIYNFNVKFLCDTINEEISNLLYREIRISRTTEEGFVILMCNFIRDKKTKKRKDTYTIHFGY